MDFSADVEKEKNELLSVLGKLVEKDTTNPPGNEHMAAEVIKRFFRENGIRYRVFEREKGRTNVIGYIGKGNPSVIIAVHMDVVPPGEGWKTDPFRMVVRDGKAFGRGVMDNKGQLASALICGKIMKSMEREMKGSLVIACVADEELGSKFGLRYLLDEKKISGDYAIVPDVETDMKRISVGEKGLLFLRVISHGKQAHGSRPHKGVNAIENMLDFLQEFRKYRYNYSPNPMFSDPTRNIGTIKGGSSVNTVPARCECAIDFRYLPSMNMEKILKDVKGMLERVKKRNKNARFETEIIDDQRPFIQKRKNELVSSLRKSFNKVRGITPETYGSPATTVAKPLAEHGIVTAMFSPGKEMAHKANECVDVRDLLDLAKIFCMTSEELLA